jgi:lysophospholipase L1-like esterase
MRFPVRFASIIAAFSLLLSASFCSAATRAENSPWVATWGAAMVSVDSGDTPDFSGKTLRQIVHASVGGEAVRVWFSNRFGTTPLHIGAAHVAITVNGPEVPAPSHRDAAEYAGPDQSGIQPGSDRTLTFNHLGSITIPPGAEVVSDPVSLNVPALSDLSISMYLPDPKGNSTVHPYADQRSYAATGNMTAAPTLLGKSWPLASWYYLSGVDVEAPGNSTVVAFGDSITDGAYATLNANHRWPDYLAARLAADPQAKKSGVQGVVDVGIGGNRVLLDGAGPNAVSRINWDILARSGARYVIVLESINDIGRFMRDHQAYGDLAQRLETGIAQIAEQAHAHGIKVYGATLTPYQGCGYYSAEGETVRGAVNEWIRTNHTLDGFVDFDKAVHDPQNPLRFAAQYDSGDHLHPKDAGYQAMANAINLALFTQK